MSDKPLTREEVAQIVGAFCEKLNATWQNRERVWDRVLTQLNAQLPYVGFQPQIQNSLIVYLAAGVARDVPLVDRTQAVRFGYALQAAPWAAPLFVGVQGRVSLPAAGNSLESADARGVIINPQGWYSCNGLRSLSLYCPADAFVTVHCHVQM